MKMKTSLLKKQLYLSLLRKDVDELTDADVNIMYSLSNDPEIQEVLEDKKEK